MNTVLFDARLRDADRRTQLYGGQLFVYSPTSSSLALVRLARQLIQEAFGTQDPETAQFQMPVERYAAVLTELKPKFIHHLESKHCIQDMLLEFGCDPVNTYFDVPRMRTSTSDNYLTSGIAYAFHPHRDTWYSAPQCQLNWWIPIYEIESDRSMALHPTYWSRAVQNTSSGYDYEEWKRSSRFIAASQIGTDTRVQPRAEEPLDLQSQLRMVAPVGSLLIFSAAHMHSTVPNTTGRTRFSIDFRTIDIDDGRAFRGAPNIDSACTGTTMGDFLRVADLEHVPAELISAYERRRAQPVRA